MKVGLIYIWTSFTTYGIKTRLGYDFRLCFPHELLSLRTNACKGSVSVTRGNFFLQLKPWSNECASHRMLTCDDLRWNQSNGGTSCHNCVLHFRGYIVWRFLDDIFLMIVHWKGVSKTRSQRLVYFRIFFLFGLGRFGFAAFAVSVALNQSNIDFIRGCHI